MWSKVHYMHRQNMQKVLPPKFLKNKVASVTYFEQFAPHALTMYII